MPLQFLRNKRRRVEELRDELKRVKSELAARDLEVTRLRNQSRCQCGRELTSIPAAIANSSPIAGQGSPVLAASQSHNACMT